MPLLAIAILLAGLLASARSPASSAPASPAAQPSDSWAGVTLYESADSVVQRLGKPDRILLPQADTTTSYEPHAGANARWFYGRTAGQGMTTVIGMVNGVVVLIGLEADSDKPYPLHVSDPYGVSLGAAASAVVQARGRPIASVPDNDAGSTTWFYGSPSGACWYYTLAAQRVAAIYLGKFATLDCTRPAPPSGR